MTTVKTSRFSAKSVRDVRFSRIKCLKSKKYIYFAINIALFCFSEETLPVQPFLFWAERWPYCRFTNLSHLYEKSPRSRSSRHPFPYVLQSFAGR